MDHVVQTSGPDVETEEIVTAVTALARASIPTDVQELLVRGDAGRGIPQGALAKLLAAVRSLHEAKTTSAGHATMMYGRDVQAEAASLFQAQSADAKALADLGRPVIDLLNEALEQVGSNFIAVLNDFGGPVGPDEAAAFREGFDLIGKLWLLSARVEALAKRED